LDSQPDVLIMAAFHPELDALRTALGNPLKGRVGSLAVAATAIGIGLPAASVGAAMRLAELRPRAAMMMGTCGAYPSAGMAIGDVIVSRRLLLVDPSALAGASQFPEPMSIAIEGHPGLVRGLATAGARPAALATTLGVTVDDTMASRIALATGAEVEHLEAHGVATASAARGIPFVAAAGVANEVGARGREQWRMNHRRAAEAVTRVVLAWLRAGGAGLAP
jgi:futalosine hydrolase